MFSLASFRRTFPQIHRSLFPKSAKAKRAAADAERSFSPAEQAASEPAPVAAALLLPEIAEPSGHLTRLLRRSQRQDRLTYSGQRRSAG